MGQDTTKNNSSRVVQVYHFFAACVRQATYLLECSPSHLNTLSQYLFVTSRLHTYMCMYFCIHTYTYTHFLQGTCAYMFHVYGGGFLACVRNHFHPKLRIPLFKAAAHNTARLEFKAEGLGTVCKALRIAVIPMHHPKSPGAHMHIIV